MSRSSPQKKIDDSAFPVRMLIYVPENGFMSLFDKIFDWLNQNIGKGDYAEHSITQLGCTRSCVSFYFRHPAAAVAFLDVFPMLELADGTMRSTYTSPVFPFGLK